MLASLSHIIVSMDRHLRESLCKMYRMRNISCCKSQLLQLTKLLFCVVSLVLSFSHTSEGSESARFVRREWQDKNAFKPNNRQNKLLPFLALVSYPETPCSGDDGQAGGICISRKKCTSSGGSSIGTCAWGYGSCCLLTTTCGSNPSVVNTNGTHLLQSEKFKSLCRYEIPKNAGVCQVRLDFVAFRIDGGTQEFLTQGECNTDTLTISGSTNGVVGPLCGDLTGQHMYLDYGGNEKINVDVYLAMDNSQQWDIKVTTIRCDSVERAPEGCLQYFTDQRGTVQSFNFPNLRQLNNEDYTVCIRADVGMNRIIWKPCGVEKDFSITGPPPVGNLGDPLSGSACTTDWVMILGVDKYCGSQFPAQVIATTKPFIMNVHFDSSEASLPPPVGCGTPENPCPGVADLDNSGFCLSFYQAPQ